MAISGRRPIKFYATGRGDLSAPPTPGIRSPGRDFRKKGIPMTNQSYAATPAGAPVKKTKWIVQLVVSLICFGNIVTLILAILGLVKVDTDLETANKYYKWGWIAYVIFLVINLILFGVIIATGTFSASVSTY